MIRMCMPDFLKIYSSSALFDAVEVLPAFNNKLLEIFSSKTTSHNGQIEVCLLVSRLLSGRYGMWSYMKMTLTIYSRHK